MRPIPVLLSLALAGSGPAVEAAEPDAAAKPRTTQQVLDSAQPGDWRTPDPASTLYMDLDAGRVIIELAPAFAPEHVANIRTLARGGFWDGLTLYRSQDNFVVQFGDITEDGVPGRPIGSARAI